MHSLFYVYGEKARKEQHSCLFCRSVIDDEKSVLKRRRQDGLGGSDDFISKRRMDVGDDDDDAEDDGGIEAKVATSKRLLSSLKNSSRRQQQKLKQKQRLNNEVGDLNGLANLGDLSSLLEMLTSESKNKESEVSCSFAQWSSAY
jgi:hypothetical protein